MRKLTLILAALAFACGGSNNGSTSGSTGSPSDDAGSAPADAGSAPDPGLDAGQPAIDAGTAPADAGSSGSIPDGGSAGGAPQDGGTAVSDCDGLAPAAPAAPVVLQIPGVNFNDSRCESGESDGTGHIAVRYQGGPSGGIFYSFFDNTGAAVGTNGGADLTLIGQQTGFMGTNCAGAECFQSYVVLGPTGTELLRKQDGVTTEFQINDPIGGIVRSRKETQTQSDLVPVFLDSIDASGTIRFSYSISANEVGASGASINGAVDRAGNLLLIWDGTARFGAKTQAAVWLDPAGVPGPIFKLPVTGLVAELTDRVGSGLFLKVGQVWSAQIDAKASTVSAAPAWIAARPNTSLHMVHGGTGYAVIPASGEAAACEQQLEVISASGKSCGTATFAIDVNACTTSSIVIGYDGTVVQQVPDERLQPSCMAAGDSCTCAWHTWPGFFK